MRKKVFLLIGLLLVGSCSYSGHLVQKPVAGNPGTVPYPGGMVPYRNDSKASARRDDALRKIVKFCGSDGYTITREGPSPSATNMSEVEFKCGGALPSAPASGGTPSAADEYKRVQRLEVNRDPNLTFSSFDPGPPSARVGGFKTANSLSLQGARAVRNAGNHSIFARERRRESLLCPIILTF